MKQKTRRYIFYGCCVAVLVVMALCICTRVVHSKPELVRTSYIVQHGDTIWDIAEQYCPDNMDVREWIYEVRKLNRAETLIHPGQELQIFEEAK